MLAVRTIVTLVRNRIPELVLLTVIQLLFITLPRSSLLYPPQPLVSTILLSTFMRSTLFDSTYE
jgi:hypothetical protein